MSSLRGEGQDGIPVDPTPTPAPADSASTSFPPFVPIDSITAKNSTAGASDSFLPEAPEMMDSTDIAEASGSSLAAPSTTMSTTIPSDERPLPPTPTTDAESTPPTPTAPVTPAKLLSLPLRSAPVSSSAGEGSSSSSVVPVVPILASTAPPAPPPPLATPPLADVLSPVSEPSLAPAAPPQSVAERVPTPAPAPVSSGARALPPPPPAEAEAEAEATPSVLTPSTPSAPTSATAPTPAAAPQPARRVSIALPQSQNQNQAPLPPTPQQSGPQDTPPSRRLSQVEYIVPRWQPDREVLYCPICFVYFSLFNRKHHCRKCGRVVCNSCSPHRIVIPHAFIVQPPEVLAAREREQAAAAAAGVLNVHAQAGASSQVSSTAFAAQSWTGFPAASALQADGVPVGGERVRLCNPCVPDPNTSPPTAPGGSRSAAHSRSRSGSSIAGTYNYSSRRQGLDFSGGASGSNSSSGDRRYTVSNAQNPGSLSSSGGRHQYYGSLPPQHSRGHRDEAGSSSQQQQQQHRRHHHQPRYQIPEEDECPVCHLELPKRTLDNWETLREQHIEECITLHSQYLMGNTSGNNGGGGGGGGGGRTRATSAATASSGASAQPTPSRNNQYTNSMSGSDGTSSSVDSTSSSGPGSAAFSPSSPRAAMTVHRHTGVFPYKATAKDCASDAECTICLEDLEVGDAMARLECFCRFHEQCIRAWFVRHPGRCPVHQHGMAD